MHFLWVVDRYANLSDAARKAITDPANDVFLSAVSAWEIAVKAARGHLVLSEPAERYVPAQRRTHRILELPLDEASVLHVARLPRPHKDPFDRMLVCQAIEHAMAIVTPDPQITQYPVRILW